MGDERPAAGPVEGLPSWFAARLPGGWCDGPLQVLADRDEVLVVATLPEPDGTAIDDDARASACEQRIHAYREATRAERVAVAEEAERRFGRKVSWGARCGDRRELFTTLSVPVMTRLRIDERLVLDTLIAAGVARSRSDALAWCVRLVGHHEEDWIAELRESLAALAAARARGPRPSGERPGPS